MGGGGQGGVAQVPSVPLHPVGQGSSSSHWLGSVTPGRARLCNELQPQWGQPSLPPSHERLRPDLQHDRPHHDPGIRSLLESLPSPPGQSWCAEKTRNADVPGPTEAPALPRARPAGVNGWGWGGHRANTGFQRPTARSGPAAVAPPCAHTWAPVRTARDTQAPRAQSPKAALGLGTTPAFLPLMGRPTTPLAWPVSVSTLFPAQG